jgi:hypothetical protein
MYIRRLVQVLRSYRKARAQCTIPQRKAMSYCPLGAVVDGWLLFPKNDCSCLKGALKKYLCLFIVFFNLCFENSSLVSMWPYEVFYLLVPTAENCSIFLLFTNLIPLLPWYLYRINYTRHFLISKAWLGLFPTLIHNCTDRVNLNSLIWDPQR